MARSSLRGPLLASGTDQLRARATCHRPLRVAALFAGIGGIEVGLHRSRHEPLLFCENDPSAQAVLRDQFPSVPLVPDVCKLDELPRGTDLLTAGFPCQDLSQAGATRGIGGERSGLVLQVIRLLERTPAQWVLLENVPFMLRLARGKALEVIIGALEHLGYRWAYRVVDTRSMGLPQRRERVFLLASLDGDPRDVLLADDDGPPLEEPPDREVAFGFYWTEGIRGLGWAVDAVPTLKGGSTIGIPSPPAILLPSGCVVTPDLLDVERLQGFAPDWTRAAENAGRRSLRWKLVGNAVTVDVADWIGRRLIEPGQYASAGWDASIKPGSAWPRAAWSMGKGRFASTASSWPVRIARPPLLEFLKHEGHPLSERATAGFLSRTKKSSLRFPGGFLNSIERHLSSVRDNSQRAESQSSARARRQGPPAPGSARN